MHKALKNKKIILGVCASISAYKAPLIVRELIRQGAEVQVVMTDSAKVFVTENTLANLSKKKVVSELFDREMQDDGAWHVQLAHWCDLLLIAPCSATTIGKLANGICDNALTTLALALPANAKVLLSPAMDYTMWENKAVQKNVQTLMEYDYHILEPEIGELSSGLFGKGRLPEIENIVNEVKHLLLTNIEHSAEDKIKQTLSSLQSALDSDKWNAEFNFELMKKEHRDYDFTGKKILITAGPTFEKIDDVRFIGNFSSGKMGFAIAEAASEAGANVRLIAGPVSLLTPENVQRADIQSAEEMYNEVMNVYQDYDIIIMTAAVSDFTPKEKFNGKIKKQSKNDNLSIELSKTKDILAELGKKKSSTQILVGFALESENELEYGREKLESKNADMIVVNSANQKDSGFGGDKNTISILLSSGVEYRFPSMLKSDCAKEILKTISSI